MAGFDPRLGRSVRLLPFVVVAITIVSTIGSVAFARANPALPGTNQAPLLSGLSAGVPSPVTSCSVGGTPSQVAYDPLNHYLYVASGNLISIVSSPCHVVATIYGADTIFDGVAYDPHTKSVLVSEAYSGQLFVVSGTSVIGSFGGSFCSPGPMAWDSAIDAMLVVDSCGQIDEVFGTTPSATTSFGECSPVAIAVAAGYVWVSDDCGAPYSVDVFSDSTLLGVGAFSLPTAPSGLAWDPVNHTVLVGSLFTHWMYVLYPATVATHVFKNTTFPLGTLLGTGGVTYSPWSHFMYVTGRVGNYLWTVSSSGAVHHFDLGYGSNGMLMVYDPSNHYVYVCGSGTGRLYVVS